MKKVLGFVLILVMALSLCACGGTSGGGNESLEDNGDGTLSYLELENSPLDGGLNITVDKNAGIVNMIITDKKGNETVEFYNFDTANSTCHRYKHVAMMGTGFNYFYDYNAGTLEKIVNLDDEDVTQSTKESGRFDGAQDETKEQVDLLIKYFADSFEMKMDEVVK